jgi:argininosuccinate synthase
MDAEPGSRHNGPRCGGAPQEGAVAVAGTIVLAYSGGLDTSVAIRWLAEHYDASVVTLTADLGQGRDVEEIRRRALRIGAKEALVVDARDMFVEYFVFPALRAGAVYEGQYPLATALARPLIAYLLVQVAHRFGAEAVAHGCTGKGNDQVRFDLAVQALDPNLRVYAPIREWSMTRDQEIAYAQERGIEIPVTQAKPYSVDANLWGRSIEAGVLEDPAVEPPEDVYEWTVPVEATPAEPATVRIGFEAGRPVSLDGERLAGRVLIERLNRLAGQHGIGRIDHVENRLVGIKSREIYEAPAAVVLHQAHAALETLTLTRDAFRFKQLVANEYADLVYNGKWFSALHQDLMAFVESNQRFVTGEVAVKLHRGTARVVGRSSPYSLYSRALATYDTGDQFDHRAAVGFIRLYGLPVVQQARVQRLPLRDALPRLPETV